MDIWKKAFQTGNNQNKNPKAEVCLAHQMLARMPSWPEWSESL